MPRTKGAGSIFFRSANGETLGGLHDGAIRARSDGPGKGARFTVTLPSIQKPGMAAAASQTVPEPPPAAQRILIIEDNRDARESLAEILRLNGHEVHVSATTREGLELATESAFDLVIVDVGLRKVCL